MDDEKTLFVTFELDGRTGNIKSIHPSAQNDQQFEIVKNAINRICRPSTFDLIKRLIRFGGRS